MLNFSLQGADRQKVNCQGRIGLRVWRESSSYQGKANTCVFTDVDLKNAVSSVESTIKETVVENEDGRVIKPRG